MSLVEVAALPALRRDSVTPRQRAVPWLKRHREPVAWFTVALSLYLTVATILVFHYHSIVGDAMSRVDNASYVLFSRDPHLAAIGFVWNPLPSLLEIPLLLLKPVFPALLALAFAGNIVSALLMAGAVAFVAVIFRDLGLGVPTRTILVAVFALNPMIAYYGANGMSEAAFVFSVVWAVRGTLRWTRTGETGGLVSAGLALSMGYLARYEAAAAAAGLVVFVVAVSFLRSRASGTRSRIEAALLDGGIVALPTALAVVLWAVASWVIVGAPFAQLTSQYGNSAQLAEQGPSATHASGSLASIAGHIASQILALEPAAAGILLFALGAALLTRSIVTVAALAVTGPVLAFEIGASALGLTFGWLRFYIMVVPLCALTAGILLAELKDRRPDWPTALRAVPAIAAVAALLSADPTTVQVWSNPSLAPEETCQYAIVRHLPPPACQPRSFTSERQVASFFDSRHLPGGSVLIDVSDGFGVVSQSRDPKQFVITPDRDFQQALADPPTFHIRYLVTVPTAGLGAADALNIAYPGIYDNGAGIGKLVAEFPAPPGSGSFDYRIYRVVASSAIGG